jgi:hypothetical protein
MVKESMLNFVAQIALGIIGATRHDSVYNPANPSGEYLRRA